MTDVCAWCLAELDYGRSRIVRVSNTDKEGTRYTIGWHLDVCATRDPVYQAVLAAPRMPENALLVLRERRRAFLEMEAQE